MWKSVALVCVVVLLIVIDSSDFTEAGARNKNKGTAAAAECQYTKGDWSACTGGQMIRTLTLNPGQAAACEATKTITKNCKAKGKAAKPVCKYNKKVPWSACNNGKMTRTVTLKGRKPGCEQSKVETKDCKA